MSIQSSLLCSLLALAALSGRLVQPVHLLDSNVGGSNQKIQSSFISDLRFHTSHGFFLCQACSQNSGVFPRACRCCLNTLVNFFVGNCYSFDVGNTIQDKGSFEISLNALLLRLLKLVPLDVELSEIDSASRPLLYKRSHSRSGLQRHYSRRKLESIPVQEKIEQRVVKLLFRFSFSLHLELRPELASKLLNSLLFIG